MNHLQLLEKYIAHIKEVEHGDFIELINTPFSSIQFTDEEVAVLRQIIADRPDYHFPEENN